MSVWVLMLLCVVQGLTEFLPVSSSGHLLFFEQVFSVSENIMFLNLFLHVATLLAVVIIYRKIIWKIIKKPFCKLTLNLLIATIISVVLAFAYEFSGIDRVVTKIYSFGFLATSILLLACHMFQKKAVVVGQNDLSLKSAAVVGVVQGIAVLPGLSRSGSTISSLVLTGNDEQKASEFSFLLSIPIIVGGFILEIFQMNKSGFNVGFFDIKIYILAFILTFTVSILALKLTIKLLKKQKFIIFSAYTFFMFIVTFLFNYVI